jgi:hypothetical protein
VKLLDSIRRLFKRKAAIPPTPQPSPLIAVEHKLASFKIHPGFVRISNDSDIPIVLTGGPLKQLMVHAHSWMLIKSPILENVSRITGFEVLHGKKVPTTEIAFINEWDALEVIDNMIEEYARSRAYDIMTPDELRVCTLPLPKRALAELIDRIGVKAERENENISTQA